LESLLSVDSSRIFTVIVFVGNSSFKTDMSDNVTYGSGLISYIKSKNKLVMDENEVVEVVSKIHSGRLAPSIKTYIQHAQHVKKIVKNKKTPRFASVTSLSHTGQTGELS